MESKPIWKILIIDDDPTIHKLLSKSLPEVHFQVESLLDSTLAFEKMREYKPHLLILDLMMPKRSGIDLCREIRENKAFDDTLIMILSAKENQTDRLDVLKYGANDYVSKPFHLTSFLRKVDHMLEKKWRIPTAVSC